MEVESKNDKILLGVTKQMKKIDYVSDMAGQFGMALMVNLLGQMTYFYTDKVGLAVGGVGIMMMIAKFIDAFTDIIVGHLIDHSKGGNEKYFKWMLKMALPAGLITFLMFTVPNDLGQGVSLIYVLVTNLLLTAVIYTMLSTPFAATLVLRTKCHSERANMGLFRALGSYFAGMIIVIVTIPVTNMLGGLQSAWIKYGAALGLVITLMLLISYRNGIKADFITGNVDKEPEEEAIPFKKAINMLINNKYWVIVLMFNLITNITNTIVVSSNAYYTKWIFGNDNLVALMGGLGLLATVLGFIVSKPLVSKLGVKRTVYFGLIGAALSAALRSIAPSNLGLFMAFSLIGSFVQIPLMTLYGVLLAMAVDYNEWKYDKKIVAVSSGAIGFGNKVGGGFGTVILSLFLFLGNYDASLAEASQSMRYAIYGFTNYLPIVLNTSMFLVFTKFDLEERLPEMRREIEERRRGNTA